MSNVILIRLSSSSSSYFLALITSLIRRALYKITPDGNGKKKFEATIRALSLLFLYYLHRLFINSHTNLHASLFKHLKSKLPDLTTTELLSFRPTQERTEDCGLEISAPPNTIEWWGSDSERERWISIFRLITINLWSISRRGTGPIRFAYFSFFCFSPFFVSCRESHRGRALFLLNSTLLLFVLV